MDNVVERIERIIRAQLDLHAGDPLTRETSVRDLGADSLDSVEILLALEEEFDYAIPDAAAERMLTVGDIVDYLATPPSQNLAVNATVCDAPSASARTTA